MKQYSENEKMELFEKFYGKEYSILRNGGDHGYESDRYRAEVARFDDVYLKTENAFVSEFVKRRQDAIASDRESAAFTRAFENLQRVLHPENIPSVDKELGFERQIRFSGVVKITNRNTGEGLRFEDMTSRDEDAFGDAVRDDDYADKGFFWAPDCNDKQNDLFDYEVDCNIVAVDVALDARGVPRVKDSKEIKFSELPASAREAVARKVLEDAGEVYTLNLSYIVDAHELAFSMGDNRFEIMDPKVTVFENSVSSATNDDGEEYYEMSGEISYKHETSPGEYEDASVNFDYRSDTMTIDVYVNHSGWMTQAGYQGEAPAYFYNHTDTIVPLVAEACETAQEGYALEEDTGRTYEEDIKGKGEEKKSEPELSNELSEHGVERKRHRRR